VTYTAPLTTELLLDQLEPWLTDDFETYLASIAQMFGETEHYSADTDDREGWTVLYDPDAAPEDALPYLAQFVGEQIRAGTSEAGKREQINDRANQRRGTPESIFFAAQRTLTGSRLVAIHERDPDVDTLLVRTYTSETPDAAVVEADIRNVLPVDVILDYAAATGQTWADVLTDHGTWAAVASAYANWGEVASDVSGSSVFTRP
jgi:hypothetical protein